MADECIVCLGTLSDTPPDISPSVSLSSPHRDGNTVDSKDAVLDAENSHGDNLIAFLPSCGHYLHNDCLKSWIERANSCPICRKTFNSVDLWAKLGGPAIESYAVQDKTQEAVIDPDILADVDENEDDLETQVCQVCQEDDNEDILMYCDSCDKLYHTYCVDLQEVPVGHWFCDNCRAQRDEPTRRALQGVRARGNNRRTRGQRRRNRQQDRVHEQNWNRVWQSVWDRINLDLDFPFDDEEATAAHIRRQRQRNDYDRRQYQAWQRRAQIAEMQGGANGFRDETHSLLEDGHDADASARRPRPTTPPRETLDELRAWHAFDRAREIESDPAPTRSSRKRKSATASPIEPQATANERRIKRPRVSRVRRQPDMAEASDSAESSSRPRRSSPHRQPVESQPAGQSGGPSFLQSLLKEVQGSSTPRERNGSNLQIHTPNGQTSPAPSSPIASPVPSNHSSPRAGSITPPPFQLHFSRPGSPNGGSPTGLSSSIQPVYPQFENGSAHPTLAESPLASSASLTHPLVKDEPEGKSLSDSEAPSGFLRRVPRSAHRHSPTHARSTETSPARQQLSLSAKQDIQKMVSSALKPFYNAGQIDKDDYTIINRDVSRSMYDKVGTDGLDALPAEIKGQMETDVQAKVQYAVDSRTTPRTTNGLSHDMNHRTSIKVEHPSTPNHEPLIKAEHPSMPNREPLIKAESPSTTYTEPSVKIEKDD